VSLRKIKDIDDWAGCNSPEHDPPGMIVLESGVYEWTCPQCGHRTVFFVARPTFALTKYVSTRPPLKQNWSL